MFIYQGRELCSCLLHGFRAPVCGPAAAFPRTVTGNWLGSGAAGEVEQLGSKLLFMWMLMFQAVASPLHLSVDLSFVKLKSLMNTCEALFYEGIFFNLNTNHKVMRINLLAKRSAHK